jgi:hypothetical protein
MGMRKERGLARMLITNSALLNNLGGNMSGSIWVSQYGELSASTNKPRKNNPLIQRF